MDSRETWVALDRRRHLALRRRGGHGARAEGRGLPKPRGPLGARRFQRQERCGGMRNERPAMNGERDEKNEPRWGCKYRTTEHEEAARYVSERQPQVYEWIKKHGGFRGFEDEPLSEQGYQMEALFFKAATEMLPNSTVIDKGQVLMALRELANPLSEEDKRWLRDVAQRSEERKKAEDEPI